MRIWLAVLGVVLLSACQPGDPAAKSVKDRLDGGDSIEFTKNGFRHGGCKPAMKDWKLSTSDQPERHRVVLGKQGAIIHPGIFNCYRIGSRVPIEIYKNPDSSGVVEVTKITWSRVENVTKGMMKGKYFESSEQFNNYLSGIKRRLEYKNDVYVSIIEFVYLKGSAKDEKIIIDEDKDGDLDDGYVETENDGEAVSRCNKDWTDILVNPAYHEPILNGDLKSYFQLGSRNCLKQGQAALIKRNLDDVEGIGKITVKKVKKFKTRALDQKYFTFSDSFNFIEFEAFIGEANKAKGEEWITVVDFEVTP